MNLTETIHAKYLERKPTAEYSSFLRKNIEIEKKLRSILTDSQQLLLSQLIDSFQSMELIDQTELIKFTISMLKELYN